MSPYKHQNAGFDEIYQSTSLARVFTVERHKKLYQKAKLTFKRLKLDRRIRTYLRDGSKGLPEMAPFDRIIATAGAAAVPPALREQLKVGGIMVIPVGGNGKQVMKKIVRNSNEDFSIEELGNFSFVPMLKEKGFD